MAYFKGQTKVTTSSYNDFRKAIMGNAYDVDYAYGAQCYDMGNIFWLNACGRWVTSKTADGGVAGGASGIWGDRFNNNRGGEFELITDYNKLKRGDIIITNNGQYGHICWLDVDNDGRTYLPVLGQNQGGTSGGVPGAECKIINWNFRSVFLGAFRYKKWNTAPTPPAPPKPTPSGKFEIGDKVVVNGPLYLSSDAAKATGAVGTLVTIITRKAPGSAHPYNTTGDLGWMDESSIQKYTEPAPTPPKPAPTGLTIGDAVEIIATGNGNSYGTANTAYGVGWTRYITAIYKDRAFPYQVGNKGKTDSANTTGFYKGSALKKK